MLVDLRSVRSSLASSSRARVSNQESSVCSKRVTAWFPRSRAAALVALGGVQLGEVQQGFALLAAIAALPEYGEALLEHGLGLAEPALQVAEESAEIVKDHGFIVAVIEASPDGKALLEVPLWLDQDGPAGDESGPSGEGFLLHHIDHRLRG